ncbi:MAG: hypothetical protein CMJ35_10980 [Phycisphaerae bacterium]|nr:hypothetical protein [Phycisphaerae bacterium]MBM92117.1 hypothetical protein [Phycisphaerae bacterium]HCT46385.1 hypothetical protein [Phycisphaerales bacterium]
MRLNRPISVSALALAMTAGGVLGGDSIADTRFPDAIASHQDLFEQELAEKMFMQLPREHQILIAEADGIGSDAFSDAFMGFSHEHASDAPALPEVDPDITAHEYLGLIVSEQLAGRLTPEQWNILNAIADTLDEGKMVPHMCFSPDTDREYAFAVNQLIEFPFQVRFQQTARWTSTATDGGGLSQGTPTTLTYSFVPDGTFVPDLGIGLGSGNSALFAWLDGVYGDTQTWQDLFHQVFDRWEELINVTYVYEPNDDGVNTNSSGGVLGVRGDVRIGAYNYQNDGNSGVLAYNNFPNDGDMIFDAFDTFYNNTGGQSIRFRNVAAHEHGHGLGMLHVCPANQTKLMEPFISVAYDGPQLDDILNGIRHYGDVYEPDNSIAEATDLGSFSIGQATTITNAGIDDNSDIDYFRVELSEASRIVFMVAPDADTYIQGPQTSSCDTGSSTNYNAVQNLQATLVDASGGFLATANETSFGETEELVYDTAGPGVFYLVVDGATSVNSVQRYIASLIVADVPFMGPLIEADVPDMVDPGVATSFDLSIDAREDTIVADSAELFVSINGGAFSASALVSNGGNSYTATLPAFDCGDSVAFYLAVEGDTDGVITLPEDGASDPFDVLVGDIVTAFSDNFEGDEGWFVSGVTGRASGAWERGVPAGDGSRGDAPNDADGSGSCYLTGNGNAGSNTDVDDGQAILTSPILNLEGNPEAIVSYSRWFDNTGSGTGAAPGEDVFKVEVSDDAGVNWTTVETVGPSTPESSGGWFDASFRVGDFVSATNAVLVRFIAEDLGDGSVVEAAVDAFSVSTLECEDPISCVADLNGDGELNFFDVSAFLTAFNGGDLEVADINGDGDLNFFDVSEFLTAFNAGCP